MKKVLKRVTAVVLSGVMALGVPAVHLPNAYGLRDLEVYAEGEQENEGKFLIQNGILKKYAGSEKDVVIPDTVTEIANGTFDGCNTLESITISKGVKTVGEYTTSMSVSSDGSLGVDSTFADCSKLTSIYVSEENPYYSSHDGCLYDKNGTRLICCPAGKKQVSIPVGVKYIDGIAFNYCTELTSISIPEGVESIAGCVFFGCKNLTDISLPEGLKNIYMQTFYDCSSLTNINIPKSVESIGRSAFKNCSSLESINLPEGILSIEDETFENCSGLKGIRIPKWVQSMGKSAFKNCSSLESISIPKSVTNIKDTAFSGCDNLTIYGEKGSYAQEYAQENKIPFVAAVILEEGKNSLSEEQMSSLAEENKEEDIVIKSANGLTYVFEKGTMKLVDGKDSYDFGAEISQDYNALSNPSFAEDEFAFRIDYNYEGQLPGTAKISIPVEDKWIGKNLCYYEIGENGEYEYIGRSTVAEDGMYTIKQEHCSGYVAITKVPGKLGDCDGEDGVTAKDALAILKYDVGIPQENFDARFADCDGEDGITSKDALCILKYDVGLIDGFAPEDFQKTWERQMEEKFGVSKEWLDYLGVEWYRRTETPPKSYMVDKPIRCDVQGYNQCWAYSLAMIFRYLGEDITGEEFFQEFPWKNENNTADPDLLAAYLKEREGYNVHLYMGDQMDLKDAVSKHGMVMLFLQTSRSHNIWHYADLSGYDEQYYYFCNPLSTLDISDRYNQVLYPEELEEIWNTEFPAYSYLFYVIDKES